MKENAQSSFVNWRLRAQINPVINMDNAYHNYLCMILSIERLSIIHKIYAKSQLFQKSDFWRVQTTSALKLLERKDCVKSQHSFSHLKLIPLCFTPESYEALLSSKKLIFTRINPKQTFNALLWFLSKNSSSLISFWNTE